MRNSEPQLVIIRPTKYPYRYLSAATNKQNALENDFDVKCIKVKSNSSYFVLIQNRENVYSIQVAQQPNHYLFCSNDNTRKHGDEFDVRTHAHNEKRNNWIIERVGWSEFTISSETNNDQYLSVCDDNVENQIQGDLDVRTYNQVGDRTKWFIQQIQNPQQLYPIHYNSLKIKLRPAHIQEFYLNLKGFHKEYNQDFIVIASETQQEYQFYLDKIADTCYTIRSVQNPLFYLFIANDKEINNFGDMDVRLHYHRETRNNWFIESDTNGFWTIRSAINHNQYLFVDQNEKNGNEMKIKCHHFVEDRNKWIIDGLEQQEEF